MILCSPACYCPPLHVIALPCMLLRSPAGYCAPLPVTVPQPFQFQLSVSQKYLLFRASCFLFTFSHCDCNRLRLHRFAQFAHYSDHRQRLNEQSKLSNMTSRFHHQLRSVHCCTCSKVLQYSTLSCN
jgi:hypothetical protein